MEDRLVRGADAHKCFDDRVVRIPVVNLHGNAVLLGKTDVCLKRGELCGVTFGPGAKEVETRFSDGASAWHRGELVDAGNRALKRAGGGVIRSLIRVNGNGGQHARFCRSSHGRPFRRRNISTDLNHTDHTDFSSAVHLLCVIDGIVAI